MLLPGFGDAYVTPRIRLILALTFSVAMLPVAQDVLPALPGNWFYVLVLILHEVVVGLLIGSIVKILTSAVHIAGTIIAAQSSLGQASLFDPSQQSQGAVFGLFMQMMTIALLFTLDLHHLLIKGLANSYQIFDPSTPFEFGDFAELAAISVAKSFAIGIQLGAPLIVIGILINLASGILARLMPAFQVFFVIMPVQIMVALFIFMISLSAICIFYMDYFEDAVTNLFMTK